MRLKPEGSSIKNIIALTLFLSSVRCNALNPKMKKNLISEIELTRSQWSEDQYRSELEAIPMPIRASTVQIVSASRENEFMVYSGTGFALDFVQNNKGSVYITGYSAEHNINEGKFQYINTSSGKLEPEESIFVPIGNDLVFFAFKLGDGENQVIPYVYGSTEVIDLNPDLLKSGDEIMLLGYPLGLDENGNPKIKYDLFPSRVKFSHYRNDGIIVIGEAGPGMSGSPAILNSKIIGYLTNYKSTFVDTFDLLPEQKLIRLFPSDFSVSYKKFLEEVKVR